MSSKLPHPIPYQGSKRNLSSLIGEHVPRNVDTWFEPFAGSAAMTIWAAHHRVAKRYVIADVLPAMADLLSAIINAPLDTAARYRDVWERQTDQDQNYFYFVRERYNTHKDPVDLLYLICRCVKNAVRFGGNGRFTQSVDKRRLGMQPHKMHAAICGASAILKGKAEVRIGDWLETTFDATVSDFVYMDPPYLGTTIGRDKRYAEQLQSDKLIYGLQALLDRGVPFALSYDGMTGEKVYGPPLPESLRLTRLLLHAGLSSQATLAGRAEETIESLYLSPGTGVARDGIIRRQKWTQERLAI
jgi:DNA adenine methylase